MSKDIIETLRRIQCSDAACGNLQIAMGVKLAIYEIKRLRLERDLLRREVCRHRAAAIQGKKPEDIAAQLQWDCFKEETDDGA